MKRASLLASFDLFFHQFIKPLYDYDHPKANLTKLDKSDAKLLDVYHTDGSSLNVKAAGILEPVGHLDFYPNNGTDQPHCHRGSLNPMDASVCDHIAAYLYFIKVRTTIKSDQFSDLMIRLKKQW